MGFCGWGIRDGIGIGMGRIRNGGCIIENGAWKTGEGRIKVGELEPWGR